ncbi:acyl carrier protein [Streptomyces sp. KL118A]|uniref:acyl carrier protein n=1 Tax=Streptomyces sp. KL118A TaxID=3045153 RepID=UPI00278C3BB6|nr:acyl carrier protein [Streptomyces sp. KL118A]
MTTRIPGQTAYATELRGWLTARLAIYLARPESSIDHDTPLAHYGMDSVWALSLCGDLEEEKDLIVDPTLVWDHPTVTDIVAHLAPRPAAARAGDGQSRHPRRPASARAGEPAPLRAGEPVPGHHGGPHDAR